MPSGELSLDLKSVAKFMVPDLDDGLYSFLRTRELENTLHLGPEYGVWPSSGVRVMFGWGTPYKSDMPQRQSGGKWPPALPSDIDSAARVNRVAAYRRIRSAAECREFLLDLHPINAGFTITDQWLRPGAERIEFDPNAKVIGAHACHFVGVDEKTGWLEFDNSIWGKQWGKNGYGWMSPDYFNNHIVEAYTIDGVGRSLAGRFGTPQPTSLSRFESMHGVIAFGDRDDTVRFAWAMFVETEAAFQVEEFYVRPEYRRNGWGERLWRQLIQLSMLYRKPLNLWVPFADCESSHLEFLRHFFGTRGYALQASDERWAGALAVPGKMPASIPLVEFPPRPAMAFGTALRAAVVAAGMALPVGMTDSVGGGEPNTATLTEQSTADHLLQSLDRFAHLDHGWNGHSALAPAPEAVQNAKDLVRLSVDMNLIPERVEPSAMGGVGVTYSKGSREIVAEFYNTGSAHALFADDATDDMTTSPVVVGPVGYREFLGEVASYLDGK